MFGIRESYLVTTRVDLPPASKQSHTLQPYKRITFLSSVSHRALGLLRSPQTHQGPLCAPPRRAHRATPASPSPLQPPSLNAVRYAQGAGRHRPVPPPPWMQPFSRGAADHRPRNPNGSKDEGAAQSPSVPAGQREAIPPGRAGSGERHRPPRAPPPSGLAANPIFLKTTYIYIFLTRNTYRASRPLRSRPPVPPRPAPSGLSCPARSGRAGAVWPPAFWTAGST